MTLTDILPSLRRTLPSPWAIDAWPEATQATPIDVIQAGVSMLRVVELCETPCVHSACAVVPGTHGRPSPDRVCTVIATTIVDLTEVGGRLRATVDARLDVAAVWTEVRVLGRVTTGVNATVDLIDVAGAAAGPVMLPGDMRVGDILVMPVPESVCLRQLRGDRSGVEVGS